LTLSFVGGRRYIDGLDNTCSARNVIWINQDNGGFDPLCCPWLIDRKELRRMRDECPRAVSDDLEDSPIKNFAMRDVFNELVVDSNLIKVSHEPDRRFHVASRKFIELRSFEEIKRTDGASPKTTQMRSSTERIPEVRYE
jgi:hypothetical protein